MLNLMIAKLLATVALSHVPAFDAAHPVESCRAAEAAHVTLVECDDVQDGTDTSEGK